MGLNGLLLHIFKGNQMDCITLPFTAVTSVEWIPAIFLGKNHRVSDHDFQGSRPLEPPEKLQYVGKSLWYNSSTAVSR